MLHEQIQRQSFVNELLLFLNTLYNIHFLGSQARLYCRTSVPFQGIPASLSALPPVCWRPATSWPASLSACFRAHSTLGTPPRHTTRRNRKYPRLHTVHHERYLEQCTTKAILNIFIRHYFEQLLINRNKMLQLMFERYSAEPIKCLPNSTHAVTSVA